MSLTPENELTPVKSSWDLEKETGFDASPNSQVIQTTLSRRPTRIADPRSALEQWTSSGRPRKFTHPMTRQRTNIDVIVTFDGPDDPYRPINWVFKKKVITVLLYGLTTACSTWNSSMYGALVVSDYCLLTHASFSTVTPIIAEDYHVSQVVSTLGITLF